MAEEVTPIRRPRKAAAKKPPKSPATSPAHPAGKAITPPAADPVVFDPAYEAHKLRMQGLDWPTVAARTGYTSNQGAVMAVRRYLSVAASQMDADQKAERLQLELDRLDALQNAVWGAALRGDDKAVNAVLSVMRHRAKLLGLEEPSGDAGAVRTIVIAGSHDEYLAGLRAVVEGRS